MLPVYVEDPKVHSSYAVVYFSNQNHQSLEVQTSTTQKFCVYVLKVHIFGFRVR